MLKLNTQNKAFQYLFIGSVSAFFSLMSFEAFFPIAMSSADSSASATLELDVEPTLGMALSDTSLNLAYNGETEILPTSAGVTATGSLDVYVATNGASGYSLTMYTPEHADMKHINSSVSNSITSTTGGANLAKNTWGFYNSTLGSWIGIGEGSNNSTTIIDNGASVNVPCDLSTTAPTSCANGTIDSTTITFGANISDSLPAGRYTNDVVFTAISNVPETRVAYTLNYNVNGGTGSIAPTHAAYPGTTGFASGSSLTPPSRSTFLGWALTSSATTPDYTPADTISTLSLIEDAIAAGQSISETQGGVIQLYAVWEETTAWMQNFTCSSLTSGQTKDLTDRRDNSVYTVKKFSSDNDSCWMIQNLRLGYDKAYTLTKDLTNITDNGSYYLPQTGHQASLDGTNVATVSFSQSSDNQARVQYATTSDLLAKDSSLANAQDTGYYNFYAATLGKSYYGLDGNVSGYIERDICPKGWQLPVNDSSNHRSWYYFYNTLNGGQHANLVSASGASFLYSGRYDPSLNYVGSSGGWWSSTVNNTNRSYLLYVGSGVAPQDNYEKYSGLAVRCVATQ